jgi:hypothetical protein
MNIHQSLTAILSEVDAIGKNRKNTQQNFMFRGIDDVYNTIHPILAKHGVFTVPTVISERSEERQSKTGGNLIYRILTVRYTFYAADGSCVEAVVIGEGMDSGDKAANKAMAVAHKYALLQVLCIPTEDMIDPDSESPEATTKAPQRTQQQPAQRASQPAPEPAQQPSLITPKQSSLMREIADKMPDKNGQDWLYRQSATSITFERAQEIIDRATAALRGGN